MHSALETAKNKFSCLRLPKYCMKNHISVVETKPQLILKASFLVYLLDSAIYPKNSIDILKSAMEIVTHW